MTDLKQRLDAVDLVPVDDVWGDVRDRLDEQTVVRTIAFREISSRRETWRKALTIAAAFAVVVGSIAVLARAFGGRDDGNVAATDAEVQIAVQGDALQVVSGDGAVWVLGTEGVTKIDPATNAVVARFDLAFPDGGRIAAGDDALWVTDYASVSRLDPDTGAVLATEDVRGAGEIEIGAGSLWVGRHIGDGPGEIVRLDATSGETLATIQLTLDPEELSFGDAVLWVEGTAPGGATVERVDPATNVSTVLFSAPSGLAFGDVEVAGGGVLGIGCDESALGAPDRGGKRRCGWSLVDIDSHGAGSSRVTFGGETIVTRANGDLALEEDRPPLLLVDGSRVFVVVHDLEPLERQAPYGVVGAKDSRGTHPRVLELDAATGATLRTIALPSALATANWPAATVSDGALWIAGGTDGHTVIVRVDPGAAGA